jgi:hypothetical protein
MSINTYAYIGKERILENNRALASPVGQVGANHSQWGVYKDLLGFELIP